MKSRYLLRQILWSEHNSFLVLFCTPWSRIFRNLKFQKFSGASCRQTLLGWVAPLNLALNLNRLLFFIGHLWKRLLRTLISYRDHKDQENAPWGRHCTIGISLLDWNSIFIWLLTALNICEAWNGWGENHEIYIKIYDGKHFKTVTVLSRNSPTPSPAPFPTSHHPGNI